MGPQGAEFELPELARDVCTGWRVHCRGKPVQDLWGWGATPVGGTGAAGEPGYATGTTAARGSAGTDLSKGEKSSTS